MISLSSFPNFKKNTARFFSKIIFEMAKPHTAAILGFRMTSEKPKIKNVKFLPLSGKSDF